jgi:hypothetical protein
MIRSIEIPTQLTETAVMAAPAAGGTVGRNRPLPHQYALAGRCAR